MADSDGLRPAHDNGYHHGHDGGVIQEGRDEGDGTYQPQLRPRARFRIAQ